MAISLDELEAALALDRTAVERCQAGDAAAFGELYRRHHDRLGRYCQYRLGDVHEADDVVQEAFLRAWNSLPSFAGEKKFYPWLRTVAANLCTDVLRKQGRSRPASDFDDHLQEAYVEASFERICEEDDRARVRAAFAQLNERYRLALTLREEEGLSYDEIANRTDSTVATVESVLWRARQALKRQFLASGESAGCLASLPVLGSMVRRMTSARHAIGARLARRAAWLGKAGASGVPAVNAVTAAVFVAAAITGVTGAIRATQTSGVAGGHPALVRTNWSLPPTSAGAGGGVQPTSSSYGAAAESGNASGSGPAGNSSGPPSGPGSGTERLVNPIQYGGPAAQQARQQPVTLSAGAVTIGLDPAGTVSYTSRIAQQLPGESPAPKAPPPSDVASVSDPAGRR